MPLLRVPGRPWSKDGRVSSGQPAEIVWSEQVRAVALPILTVPYTKVSIGKLLMAFTTVSEIMTGALAPATPMQPLASHGKVVVLPPDLEGLRWLRHALRDLAVAACPRPAVIQVVNEPTVTTQRILDGFATFEFGAVIVAHAVFSRFNANIEVHSMHALGECPCADVSPPLFTDDMDATHELMMVWNLRVVSPATALLEGSMIQRLEELWRGESGDAQMVIAVLNMARKVGAYKWAADAILDAWTRHCRQLSATLIAANDRTAAMMEIERGLTDMESRVMPPLPQDTARQMRGIAASALVLMHKPMWRECMLTWYAAGAIPHLQALWRLRSYAVKAGASGQFVEDGLCAAAVCHMQSLKQKLLSTMSPSGDVKPADFRALLIDPFSDQLALVVTEAFGGEPGLEATAAEAAYTELFQPPHAALQERLAPEEYPRGVPPIVTERLRREEGDFYALLTAQGIHHALASPAQADSRERDVGRLLGLLQYQPSPDVCLHDTRLFLEQRLMNAGPGADLSGEYELVQRLQADGHHVAARGMLGVLTDYQRSRAEDAEFVVALANEPPVSIVVLKSGGWKVPAPLPLFLASLPVLQRQVKRFSSTYLRHASRRNRILDWSHSNSSAKLSLLFLKSRHTLHLPLASAAALLHLDTVDCDTVAPEDVAKELNPSGDAGCAAHIAKCLAGLVRAKVLGLSSGGALDNPDAMAGLVSAVKGAGRAPASHLRLTLNRAFRVNRRETNLLVRVAQSARLRSGAGGKKRAAPPDAGRTSSPAAPGGAEDDEGAAVSAASLDQLIASRKMLLESTVVRVLKSRRVVHHADLVATVVDVVKGRFTPTPGEVKAAVERLLDRDYCERAPDDPSTYHYLA